MPEKIKYKALKAWYESHVDQVPTFLDCGHITYHNAPQNVLDDIALVQRDWDRCIKIGRDVSLSRPIEAAVERLRKLYYHICRDLNEKQSIRKQQSKTGS